MRLLLLTPFIAFGLLTANSPLKSPKSVQVIWASTGFSYPLTTDSREKYLVWNERLGVIEASFIKVGGEYKWVTCDNFYPQTAFTWWARMPSSPRPGKRLNWITGKMEGQNAEKY